MGSREGAKVSSVKKARKNFFFFFEDTVSKRGRILSNLYHGLFLLVFFLLAELGRVEIHQEI